MEEEKKTPQTSEPNPNGENNEVDESDLDEEGQSASNPEAGDNGKKPEGEDPKEPEEEGKKPNPQKQSRELDAKFAEERRKRKEREEAQKKKHDEEVANKALFDYKSSQVTKDELNELGLSKVEDEEQMFLVESLRKAKSDGVENPVASAYQSLFKKNSEEKATKKAEEEAKEAARKKREATVAEDQRNFKAKFGKSTADAMKEEEFMNLFGAALDPDKGNFTELYSGYSEMKKKQSEEGKRKGSFTPGSNGNGGGNEQGNKPRTREEFEKYWAEKYNS